MILELYILFFPYIGTILFMCLCNGIMKKEEEEKKHHLLKYEIATRVKFDRNLWKICCRIQEILKPVNQSIVRSRAKRGLFMSYNLLVYLNKMHYADDCICFISKIGLSFLHIPFYFLLFIRSHEKLMHTFVELKCHMKSYGGCVDVFA